MTDAPRKLRVIDMSAIPTAHVRLVCPVCHIDTATGLCELCGTDWCDGLSDWLIRPRDDTSARDALEPAMKRALARLGLEE